MHEHAHEGNLFSGAIWVYIESMGVRRGITLFAWTNDNELINRIAWTASLFIIKYNLCIPTHERCTLHFVYKNMNT